MSKCCDYISVSDSARFPLGLEPIIAFSVLNIIDLYGMVGNFDHVFQMATNIETSDSSEEKKFPAQ